MLELRVGVLGQQRNAVIIGDVVSIGGDVRFGPLIAWVGILVGALVSDRQGFDRKRCGSRRWRTRWSQCPSLNEMRGDVSVVW